MDKKTNTLVTTIIGGVATIASAIVTFINPAYATAIVASLGIVATAAIDIVNLFTEDTTTKE